MKGARGNYFFLGIALIFGGCLFALVSWLLLTYMPLSALGVSAAILGSVSLVLGRSLPRISPDTSLMLMKVGFDNIQSLVEELGLRSKAVYLPTTLTQGEPRALIPLLGNPTPPAIQRHLERRLIVRFGSGKEHYGVLLATPGSSALGLAEIPEEESPNKLLETLSTLLIGTLDIVDAVQVSSAAGHVIVQVRRPTLSSGTHPAYELLGSPVASIVAAVVAESFGRPVSVTSEMPRGRWHVIEVELHPEVVL